MDAAETDGEIETSGVRSAKTPDREQGRKYCASAGDIEAGKKAAPPIMQRLRCMKRPPTPRRPDGMGRGQGPLSIGANQSAILETSAEKYGSSSLRGTAFLCSRSGSRSAKGAQRHILQTLKFDSAQPGGRAFEWTETDMLPVSGRESSAFNPEIVWIRKHIIFCSMI